MSRRLPLALVALTTAGVALVVGTFLPWLRTGSTSRSSYDLLGLVGRLDIAPDGPATMLIRGWPFVPLLVTTAVVLAWWRRRRAALVVAVPAALYAGGIAAVLAVGASGTAIDVGVGPWTSATAGVLFLAAAVVLNLRSATAPAPSAHREALPADPS